MRPLRWLTQSLAIACLVSGSSWAQEAPVRDWGESYFEGMSSPDAAEILRSILTKGAEQDLFADLSATYSALRYPSTALIAEIALDAMRGVDFDDVADGRETRIGSLSGYGFISCPLFSNPPTYEAALKGIDDESIARRIAEHAGRWEWDAALMLGRTNLVDRHVHCELVIEWAKVEFEQGMLSQQNADWVWLELAFRSLIELRKWGTDFDGGFDTEVDLLFWMSDVCLKADAPELSLALAVVVSDLKDEYEASENQDLVQPTTSQSRIRQRIEALEPMVNVGD